MDHEAYLAAVRSESERFLDVLAGAPPTARVPACPDWSADDLLWHLAGVQHFWSEVVGEGLDDDSIDEPERPADVDLRRFAAEQGTALLAALASKDPHEPCYSWHDDGGSVGWVARRQAHEALIHRVDAEQVAGVPVTPPPVALAVDGVDELLRVMVAGVPEWGTFTSDGSRVVLHATNDDGAAWVVGLGRFTGTSPASGRTYDLDAAEVLSGRGDPAPPDGTGPLATVAGAAWDLDLWLWGRGPLDALEVTGDRALVTRLRDLVADGTQ